MVGCGAETPVVGEQLNVALVFDEVWVLEVELVVVECFVVLVDDDDDDFVVDEVRVLEAELVVVERFVELVDDDLVVDVDVTDFELLLLLACGNVIVE